MSIVDAVSPVDMVLDEPLANLLERGNGIGFVGPDVPLDVLLASGRPFGHLPWLAEAPTPWADQWLESGFPFWARSIVEQWHAGRYDGLDQVVFSRADDASQRLYYYIAELRRRGKLAGPAPQLFDIAYVPRDSSLEHASAAVTALMQWLEVDAGALAAGIESANDLRRQVDRIQRARTADGPAFERFARAALWTDPTQWLDEFVPPDRAAAGARVLLAGSMPVDERLHLAVESAGASVVAEAHAFAASRYGPELTTAAADARAIARHLRQHSIAPRAFLDRAQWLVDQSIAARADAVILWLTREDEALAWPVPAQRQALADAGIRSLVLPAARWQADDDSRDRIAGFLLETAHATA
jgi:hypothetical protein